MTTAQKIREFLACPDCGSSKKPLLVTACVGEWDADDGQVDEMGKEYSYLKEECVFTPKEICVGVHICPDCKTWIGKPWIEEA